MTIGNDEGEATSGAKQEGEGEIKLWLTKRFKHQMDQEEQYSLWSILFALPRQSNYTNIKPEVVSGVGVLTTSCGIAQNTLANLHGKWIQTQKRGWQRREARHLRSQLSPSEHPQKRLLKYKYIMKDSLPESRPTLSLEWTQKHSQD